MMPSSLIWDLVGGHSLLCCEPPRSSHEWRLPSSTPYPFNVGNYVVEIRKCRAYAPAASSEDRNLSGLAIAVLKRDAEGRNEEMLLLPGDCAFHRIPGLPNPELRGLTAYHHGSHMHWKDPDTYDRIASFKRRRTLVW